MFSRKQMLKILATFPVAGGLASTGLVRTAAGARLEKPTHRRNYFKELGLRPLINGRGVVTTLTGSLMPPEVLDAMNFAAQQFISLIDLNEKVGERIAEMLNCEDALVSAGAASAIQLATAAAVTGKDREKIGQVPNLPGPKREVVMQKGHRIYAQQFLACGVKLVEVEGSGEMEQAVNKHTAMAFHYNASSEHSISREEFVRIGKKHNVPTFIDCASDVPPVENLFKYTEMGFDMVTFSGGKGIRGPQSAGLLFGRKDLIEAARMNHSPYGSIGRGMKVNKEEILGMMVALELYLEKDHDKEWKQWERWVEQIASSIRSLSSVKTERYVPEIKNHVPHLKITWDEAIVKISPPEVVQKLRHGYPSIETLGGQDSIIYNMFMLQSEEIDIVASRTKEILEEAV